MDKNRGTIKASLPDGRVIIKMPHINYDYDVDDFDLELIDAANDAMQNIPEYIPTNREKSKKAKKSKHYCMACDTNLVGQVGKCPKCGKRANRKKSKGKSWE